MGTYENFYLNQIKQLQEENKKLKQIINEALPPFAAGLAGAAATGVALGTYVGNKMDEKERAEYAKPLDKQGDREGKGYLGSPEDLERRNKAAQRRAADELKMRAAGFGDPRYESKPRPRPIPGA
jgi:hypothetical protein